MPIPVPGDLVLQAPLASNAVLGPDKERAFPNSYYACDIFRGFVCMDTLMLQRIPPVYTQAAFRAVFGINHFCASSYRKHRRTYELNQDLVPKYVSLEYDAAGAWKFFLSESMELVVEEDSEPNDSGTSSQAGASSVTAAPVLSFDTSHEMPAQNFISDTEEDDYSSDPSDSDMESDLGDSDVDYNMCCAYCDGKLPAAPSGELLRLQRLLDAKSTFDGYDGRDASLNPNHRYIRPITATVSYCAQHRFELKLVAMLRNSAWAAAVPVNFAALKARVELLLPRLHIVTEQPWDNEFYIDLGTAISSAGTAGTLGIAGEYSSFRKTSAG